MPSVNIQWFYLVKSAEWVTTAMPINFGLTQSGRVGSKMHVRQRCWERTSPRASRDFYVASETSRTRERRRSGNWESWPQRLALAMVTRAACEKFRRQFDLSPQPPDGLMAAITRVAFSCFSWNFDFCHQQRGKVLHGGRNAICALLERMCAYSNEILRQDVKALVLLSPTWVSWRNKKVPIAKC